MLAGGASRRLGGSPKGLEEVGGRRILDRVCDALRPATRELLLGANHPDAASWLPGITVLTDRHPGAGGLAGVEAALHSRRADTLVVAWDMPFVTTALLEALVERAYRTAADVVLPESPSPYGIEPFCAFYAAHLAGPLSRFLDAGGGAARMFLATLKRVERFELVLVRELGDPDRLFFSVNTPEDLHRARAIG